MPSVNVAKSGCSSATLIRKLVGAHPEAVGNTSGEYSPRTATARNRGPLEKQVADSMKAELIAGSTAPVADAAITTASAINAPAPNRQTVARSSIWPAPPLWCLITIHPASEELRDPHELQQRVPRGHHPKQMNRRCSPTSAPPPAAQSRVARRPLSGLTPARNREWTTAPIAGGTAHRSASTRRSRTRQRVVDARSGFRIYR